MRRVAAAGAAFLAVVWLGDDLWAAASAEVRERLEAVDFAWPSGDGQSGGGGRGCPRRVDGYSEEQVANARIIARVGREEDMPDRAIVVALATAMQESRLHNTTDHPPGEDSAGLFQQRPSMGWGTYDEVMDPEHAARSFYRTLRNVDGWEEMRVTEAAQAVQRSAFPEAYAQHEDEAERLAQAIDGCR